MIKINRIVAVVLALAGVMGSAMECRAVSEREMEEARTIAAKAYLRYANNGSGYLDDVNAKSISELQKSLKAKEKENIKAFLAIPVPSDYAAWDKTKLVEYWGSTAFKAAGLIEDGKGARPRVRKQIMAMSVSAPSAAAPAESVPAESAPVKASVAENAVADTTATAAMDPAEQQADILADQKAIEDDAKNAAPESQNSGSNSTWIYVVILCVLIGVVIWLVTFAAKVMNRQPDGSGKNDDEAEEIRAKARQAIASYKEKLAAHEDVERELKEREQEHARREQQLLARISELEEKLRKTEARSNRETAPAPAPAPAPVASPVQPKAAPVQEEILHVIYLGRANSRGIFVRADRRLSPGNTIYRLDTEDGLVGTFHVVDNPAVTAIALEHPLEMLSGGCSAIDIEDTVGATSIVTESSGTAIFENGYWKVLRKSSIRYE